jgi:hypothetical protein
VGVTGALGNKILGGVKVSVGVPVVVVNGVIWQKETIATVMQISRGSEETPVGVAPEKKPVAIVSYTSSFTYHQCQ